jgi:hypothetical protein
MLDRGSSGFFCTAGVSCWPEGLAALAGRRVIPSPRWSRAGSSVAQDRDRTTILYRAPGALATRRELPILVIHAVGEADMPRLPIIFGQEPDAHRHCRKRLNVLAARMDDYHFKAV